MADTKHVHDTPPIEGDGVSYSGIVWFVVILTATTLACQLIVWGGFEFMQWRVGRNDAARAPLAAERPRPEIKDGRMITNTPESPQPALLVTEPIALREHRANETSSLSAYGWIDRNAGTVRIPIERAKTLLIERGLPTRPGAAATTATSAAPAAPATAPPPAPARPAATGGH
jgi:hypothetical protein